MDAQLIDSRRAAQLVALRVRHADADLCTARLSEVNATLTRVDGFESLDVIRRDGGLGTDFYVIARFRDAEALAAWQASPARMTQLGQIEAMAITDISRQQAEGSSIWFEPVSDMPSPPKPPNFWKRWVVSMLAVYPALIVLVTVLAPVTAQLPQAVGLLIVALILTGLTTAYIIPWLSQTLHGWLVDR